VTSSDPTGGSDGEAIGARRRFAGWGLVLVTVLGGVGLDALTSDGGGSTDSVDMAREAGAAGRARPTDVPVTTPTSVASVVSSVPVPAASESFEIFHAVPATPVDAYIDGELVTAGFSPGTLAGPLPVSDAGRILQFFARSDDPAAEAGDRSDEALFAAALEPDGAGALVAFPGPDGSLRLEYFGYDLAPLAAGRSRLTLQHVGATGPVTVLVDGRSVTATLEPGGAVTVDVGPGPHRIEVADAAGETLLVHAVVTIEGELTSTWIRGGNGEPFTTSIRRVGDL
jgi:hypothetical protein